MDDAREWTATAPAAGAAAAVQPGDPWGAPVWRPEPRAVDSSDAATFVPAGVRRRGAALVVDLIIIVILRAVGSWLASGIVRLAPSVYVAAQAFGLTWQLVMPAAYLVLSHGTGGQTVGKRLLGVRVVDRSGAPIGYLHALGRLIATVVAALPLGIGLAVAGLRRDRRGLHDLLAGTWVVRVR
jgi:uncharacterized RDD family membrane protein YckC